MDKAKIKLFRRTCKHCKVKFETKYFSQINCSVPCAIAYTKKKAEAKELKDWKVRKKDLKEKLKTLSEYELEARKPFQAWIRERDKDLPCISCGVEYSDSWQGSHFYKAEIYSGLIFNEMNVHKACKKCNLFLNGNELGYREGLIKRYGKIYIELLEELKNESRDYKYTKEELLEIKKIYQQRLKEIK